MRKNKKTYQKCKFFKLENSYLGDKVYYKHVCGMDNDTCSGFWFNIPCNKYKPNFQEVVRKTILKSKRRNKSAIS